MTLSKKQLTFLATIYVTVIVLAVVSAGCANNEVTSSHKDEPLTKTEIAVIAAKKADDERVVVAVDWIEGNQNIVDNQSGYEHVLTFADSESRYRPTQSTQAPIEAPVPANDQANLARALAIAEHQEAEKAEKITEVLLKPAPEKLAANNASTDNLQSAWAKYCYHEPLTEAETEIVKNSQMPSYLADSCIPDK